MRRVLLLLAGLVALAAAACSRGGGRADGPVDPLEVPLDDTLPEVAEAVRAAREKTRAHPEYDANWGELGMVYLANDVLVPAAASFRVALERDPDDARWLYFLARTRVRQGAEEEALGLLRSSAAAAPEESCPRAVLGELLVERGALEEARPVLEEALALDPVDPLAAATLGRLLLQRGAPEEAAGLLERVLAAHPGDGHLRLLLGTALRRAGRVDEARTVLAPGTDGVGTQLYHTWERELALRRVESRTVVWTEALDRMNAGDFEGALELANGLSVRYPEDPQLWNFLGQLNARAGHPDEALAALRRSLELEPGRREALLDLTGVLLSLGRLQPALEAVDRAIEQHPGYSKAYRYRALILERLRRTDEAAAAFRRALDADARDATLWSDYGRFELRREGWARAAEAFEGALATGQGTPEDRLGLAEACLGLGELDRASAALDALGPDAEVDARALARLRRRIDRAR